MTRTGLCIGGPLAGQKRSSEMEWIGVEIHTGPLACWYPDTPGAPACAEIKRYHHCVVADGSGERLHLWLFDQLPEPRNYRDAVDLLIDQYSVEARAARVRQNI